MPGVGLDRRRAGRRRRRPRRRRCRPDRRRCRAGRRSRRSGSCRRSRCAPSTSVSASSGLRAGVLRADVDTGIRLDAVAPAVAVGIRDDRIGATVVRAVPDAAAISTPSASASASVSVSSGSVPVSLALTKTPVSVSTASSSPSPSSSASQTLPVEVAVGVELVEIVRGRAVVEAVEHGVLVAVDAHARARARRRAGVGERTLASRPARAARRRRSCCRDRPGTDPTAGASSRAAAPSTLPFTIRSHSVTMPPRISDVNAVPARCDQQVDARVRRRPRWSRSSVICWPTIGARSVGNASMKALEIELLLIRVERRRSPGRPANRGRSSSCRSSRRAGSPSRGSGCRSSSRPPVVGPNIPTFVYMLRRCGILKFCAGSAAFDLAELVPKKPFAGVDHVAVVALARLGVVRRVRRGAPGRPRG